jgi:hypothetical protein
MRNVFFISLINQLSRSAFIKASELCLPHGDDSYHI